MTRAGEGRGLVNRTVDKMAGDGHPGPILATKTQWPCGASLVRQLPVPELTFTGPTLIVHDNSNAHVHNFILRANQCLQK